MKKSISMLLLMVLAVSFVLAGCGSSSNNANNTATNTNTGNTTETNNTATNTTTEPAEEPAAEEPAATDEVVTITYGTWGDKADNGAEMKRIKAFEAAHPNIKVVIDKSMDWPWDEKLAAAAAANKLPDVTWLFNVPLAVGSGWLEDLTPYLEQDPDFAPDKIYGNLADTGKYNGKQFALPHGLFSWGVYINKDLFAKANIPIPSANWTVSDLEDISKKLTNFNEQQFGIDGAAGMADVLIPNIDNTLGASTWDGTQYNYTNPAWAQAVNWATNFGMKDKSSLQSYKKEQKDKWYGKDISGFNIGKVGMVFDATWSLTWYKQNLKFNWDILPVPGYDGQQQKAGLVTDYAGVTKSSKHKKEAVEFLKWMTYSKDGWLARIKDESPLASMPLVNDPTVWEAWLAQDFVTPGVKDIVKSIPTGVLETFKYQPGFADFTAKVKDKYNEKFQKGEARPEDVAAELQEKSMEYYNNAMAKITEATK
ncbi:extracellular solute-binding protein [Paenibacillus lignilyticus]|uniref:Extracellular solute-binding protein n=1 Tax=Paenibacillus lignilyticus TaxID=1172615 RepID=A0ABS5C6V8_9BACL|nr:extracellular solute-binding protein [Paenibacillus lignilyticus]MBP3961736.1 extracellular solute-binding protein [Paenibacillus lignilyticus]MBP3963593.1 extracellular solute-binding protein [Paenibacillus lignilyticus]